MSKPLTTIAVIGAGAWGTALAQILSEAGRQVTLYAREPKLAEALNKTHENAVYLPGAKLSAALRATADPKEAVAGAGLVLLATPAQYVRDTLKKFLPFFPRGVPLIQTAKGIEISTGFLMSEVAAEVAKGHPYAVLSGPSFATESVKGLPTAVTLATAADEATALLWAESIRGKAFRPYVSQDPVGVEIAGALKNVIAIACGMVEGMHLGENAKMAVMTRGLAETRRLGVKRGAKPETFLGLAGVGDLALTCSSMTSRNFSLGFGLGEGRSLAEIMAGRRSVAEGVTTAKAVASDAARHGVDMPISLTVQAVLSGQASVKDVAAGLLSRSLKQETE
jgi:glycerol-3-phosphate dehydrogenase (NAD(P)+)